MTFSFGDRNRAKLREVTIRTLKNDKNRKPLHLCRVAVLKNRLEALCTDSRLCRVDAIRLWPQFQESKEDSLLVGY